MKNDTMEISLKDGNQEYIERSNENQRQPKWQPY
jgi:hypothetical protein